MEIADHIACLRSEGELLAEAAARISLSAPVPACPGWRVRDLLAHLGFVHRWATGYVAEGRTEATSEPGEERIIRLAPADESLVGWFRAGHARLVSVLAAADPAVRCWTFLPAPSPLAFWARRQAHETAIHRADAQLAVAAAGPGADLDPFPAGLAADGVDELLMGFGGRNPGSLSDAPATLVIRAQDGAAAAEWSVIMGQPRAGVSRGPDPAAAPPPMAAPAAAAASANCATRAGHTVLHVTAARAAADGSLTLTASPARLVCGAGADSRFALAPAAVIAHVIRGASVMVFPGSSMRPEPITAAACCCWIRNPSSRSAGRRGGRSGDCSSSTRPSSGDCGSGTPASWPGRTGWAAPASTGPRTTCRGSGRRRTSTSRRGRSGPGCTPWAIACSPSSAGPNAAATPRSAMATRCPASTSPGGPARGSSSRSNGVALRRGHPQLEPDLAGARHPHPARPVVAVA